MKGGWWAKGLIFEKCMCTLVCPGHMHFTQLCTHDRCKGYWALRFDDGGPWVAACDRLGGNRIVVGIALMAAAGSRL